MFGESRNLDLSSQTSFIFNCLMIDGVNFAKSCLCTPAGQDTPGSYARVFHFKTRFSQWDLPTHYVWTATLCKVLLGEFLSHQREIFVIRKPSANYWPYVGKRLKPEAFQYISVKKVTVQYVLNTIVLNTSLALSDPGVWWLDRLEMIHFCQTSDDIAIFFWLSEPDRTGDATPIARNDATDDDSWSVLVKAPPSAPARNVWKCCVVLFLIHTNPSPCCEEGISCLY